jgi:MFS family permease
MERRKSTQPLAAMKSHRLPKIVWLLGLVSLCMDFSSEMIHAYLPVFIRDVLGASVITLGLIEGIAEGTASISKVFSGVLSDWFGRRKPLVVLGYGLAALSKPLFPLARSAEWVLLARFADRIGKGIRGAPRDALIADVTPADIRGAAFGLRQSLDTAGALLGPLAAIGLMWLLAGDIRRVFWIATIPAIVAVAMLVIGIEEPSEHEGAKEKSRVPSWSEVRKFSPAFWFVVLIGAVFTMARFSEAFLVIRASDGGLRIEWIPLVLVVMNLVYVVSAYPAGWLSDRVGRMALLMLGLAVLAVADALLATTQHLNIVFVGIALWGLHLGITQGLFSALVADTAPADLRGSAFGVFNFVSGVVAVASSLLAGALWKYSGPSTTFFTGAAFSTLALAGLIAAWVGRPQTESQTGASN